MHWCQIANKIVEVSEMKFLNKSAKANGALIAVIALVAALFYFGGGVTTQSGTPATGGQAAPAANIVTVVGAPCTQGTTLSVSTIRRYTDVAQTAQNATILQNGVFRATTAHGSTVTVQSGSNGDTLDLYPAFESTTFYPQHLKGKLETCTSSATTGDTSFKFVEDKVADSAFNSLSYNFAGYASTPNKLVQIDTAPTITIVNDGQASQNSQGLSGANLTIGTGGTASATISIYPTYNTGWGAIGGNVLACQFPSAVYDNLKPLRPTWNGAELQETNVKPSSTNFALSQANNTIKAFAAPPIDGRLQTKIDLNIQLRADSNHNPRAGNLDDVNCTIDDVSFYQRQSDGAYILDIENRDTLVELGGAKTVYDFRIGVE